MYNISLFGIITMNTPVQQIQSNKKIKEKNNEKTRRQPSQRKYLQIMYLLRY
jgi:hypothetical protein